jgi:hypothetical protein
MSAKSIFIAFTGPKIQQRIPPMNENVLKNYKRGATAGDTPFGISSEDYARCSWGLLLPDLVPESLGNGYAEIVFLLSLYSPRFLYPVFNLSDFGI